MSIVASNSCIEIRGLTRTFRGRAKTADGTRKVSVALDDVALSVGYGEVRGLLGPNGAGKTTLCKIISTILLPTSGEVRVCGHDVVSEARAVRARIGIVFGGDRGLYGRLTVRQNLQHWGALYGLRGQALNTRLDELIGRFGMTARQHDRVEGFSRGMKQRVHLARGLIGDPPVVLLDEPTDGIDPVGARDFRTLVEQLRRAGKTILITTHDMAEAEQVCDQVSFIDNGRLIATEPPSALGSLVSRCERVDAWQVPQQVRERISRLAGVRLVEELPDGYLRFHADDQATAGEILLSLVQAGVTRVRNTVPDLEEVYLHLIGDRGMKVH
ncbi:ABC-2 type transport system ATP-binding protein [Amycolatopsis rubida]|uniref:ABC-2 type transport system ATP-binding protein n=1 Tax=Amycolatopsis rubida TaxID=112413 RepID=A0A1I5ZBN3_9PSEU|nr:ABC-2 type transport system ATP-binding protein [Amycolatopsis rubida]